MRFWLTENGVPVRPVTGTDIRLAHPEVSFPNGEFTAEMMAEYGAVPLVETPEPLHDKTTHKAVEIDPIFIDGQLVQQFSVVALSLDELKTVRSEEVEAITVTTASGNTFDGNEASQTRMARAILAMNETDELPWVMADNKVVLVGRVELQEALRLAGLAMAYAWVKPYSVG